MPVCPSQPIAPDDIDRWIPTVLATLQGLPGSDQQRALLRAADLAEEAAVQAIAVRLPWPLGQLPGICDHAQAILQAIRKGEGIPVTDPAIDRRARELLDALRAAGVPDDRLPAAINAVLRHVRERAERLSIADIFRLAGDPVAD